MLIYWHIYLVGNWIEVVEQQSSLLSSSLLYQNCGKLTIGIVGDEQIACQAKKIIAEKLNISSVDKVNYLYSKENVGEYLTLQKLYEDSIVSQNDDYILYFHTKGVTRYIPNRPSYNLFYFYWRKTMEIFLIQNWEKCINLMNSDLTIDVCGVFFADRRFKSFNREERYIYAKREPIFNKKHTVGWRRMGQLDLRFAGNFWWTKISHIKSMNGDVVRVKLQPLTNKLFGRVGHEQFICSRPLPYFVFSFCNIDYFCNPRKYVGKPEKIEKQTTSFFNLIKHKNKDEKLCI